eukprot:gene24990-32567_t
MAALTSHHDETRQGVGITAHVCAYVRGVESAKSPAYRMIHDPYASALAGEVAEEYMKKAGSVGHFLLFSSIGRSIIWAMSPIIGTNANLGMVDAMIVRTKHIDEEMKTALATNSIDQVCVLGAGLDSRAWRLKIADIFKDSTTAIRPTSSKIGYFEIDFPELFNYKLSVLANVSTSDFDYHPVTCDLSLPTWAQGLTAAGFDPSKKTLCGSKIIATFIKPTAGAVKLAGNMHKYRPADPVGLLSSYGWCNGVEEDFEDVGVRLKRIIVPVGSIRGNVFVTADFRST